MGKARAESRKGLQLPRKRQLAAKTMVEPLKRGHCELPFCTLFQDFPLSETFNVND